MHMFHALLNRFKDVHRYFADSGLQMTDATTKPTKPCPKPRKVPCFLVFLPKVEARVAK